MSVVNFLSTLFANTLKPFKRISEPLHFYLRTRTHALFFCFQDEIIAICKNKVDDFTRVLHEVKDEIYISKERDEVLSK